MRPHLRHLPRTPILFRSSTFLTLKTQVKLFQLPGPPLFNVITSFHGEIYITTKITLNVFRKNFLFYVFMMSLPRFQPTLFQKHVEGEVTKFRTPLL